MPPQDLPPGLYDHPLSTAIHQALASTPDSLHQLQPLDPAEAPQRLALQAECPSADRIDLLCAFIKWSGLRLLQESLAAHLAAGRPLRVLTTVYMGASNLSAPALLDGLEWNVRLAALETPAMLAKFQSTFQANLEEGEFEPYAATPEEQARIDHHLARARGDDDASGSAAPVWFDLRPYAYQREMLDALAADRSLHQRWRNLVVAATGTGKTVLAAFDVARLHADFPEQFPSPEHPPLLLIAHRKEILLQALATFRQVLRDPSFGELYVDGELPSQCDLLFITLRKSEVLFSPSTRYRDLALGPHLFHWESQSTTTASSATGQGYIHHATRCSKVLLFARKQRKQDGRAGGPPNRSCVWGLPATKATRVSRSGLSQSGDSQTAGAPDPGGVVTRLLLGKKAAVAV
jgi:HKD family nuclease